MKNIVIVGAGTIGQYISSILSKEGYDVTLLDHDALTLEKAGWDMDVMTRVGKATDWELLDSLLDIAPDFFIALTNRDETNLAACTIARNLGYPKTIARVHDNRFLNRSRLDFFRIFDVDDLVCPELLVAHDIVKFLLSPGSLLLETFAHGAILMRGLLVPASWSSGDKTFSELELPKGMICGLIARRVDGEKTIIFPHGDDVILPYDEVTFIGESEAVSKAHHFFGLEEKEIRSCVIIGGSLTALNLAQILDTRGISVRIIESDLKRCEELSDLLPNSSIIYHDVLDLNFYESEKIGDFDAFIACTKDDAKNILAARLGKSVGCSTVIALLTDTKLVPFVEEIQADYIVSPKLSAANHIMSILFSKNVAELVSIYDNQVEVMEVKVSSSSKLVGIPLKELGPYLPRDFLIATIQNRGRILIPSGNRILSPGDTVVLLTSPKHIVEIERLF